ncbi:hypothetical protein ACLNB1_10325, partial [Streptococcus pneumoniae]|uniref:hypothetical protein n=1 Tax=Streptococcus pneumoniae TaxID=1313 RepID=UPI00398F58F6
MCRIFECFRRNLHLLAQVVQIAQGGEPVGQQNRVISSLKVSELHRTQIGQPFQIESRVFGPLGV